MKIITFAPIFISFAFSTLIKAQSFNDERTSAINFVKRVYVSSPFEGVKKIEGDLSNYHVVAVSYLSMSNDSILINASKAQEKAQNIAEKGFAEPCVKFEMIDYIINNNQIVYLFLCTTLDEFITELLKTRIIDGAKIICAPGNKYLVAFISLDDTKYSSSEMQDKASFMKAKQFINLLINGSTIAYDQVIRTDDSDSRTEISVVETVREHSAGFIQGLELLFAKKLTFNKTTYVYFTKF